MDEFPENYGQRKGRGEHIQGNGVGLMAEPSHAGEDEEGAGEGSGGSTDENGSAGAEEPEGRRDHYKDAQPSDLARRSEDSVGGDGEAEPSDR